MPSKIPITELQNGIFEMHDNNHNAIKSRSYISPQNKSITLTSMKFTMENMLIHWIE